MPPCGRFTGVGPNKKEGGKPCRLYRLIPAWRSSRSTGAACCASTPATPNLYHRFFDLREQLAELEADLTRRTKALEETPDAGARTAGELVLLAEYDRRIKTMLGEVFGKHNDFDALLDGVNLAGLGGQRPPGRAEPARRAGPGAAAGRAGYAGSHGPARPLPKPPPPARRARRMNAWTLPVCVTVGGQPRAVYTDYRDILYLLNWLDGPRGAALRPDERWYVALALFYRDFAALDPALYPEAAAALAAFLAAGQPAAPAGAPADRLAEGRRADRGRGEPRGRVRGAGAALPALVELYRLVCGHRRRRAGHGGGHPRKARPRQTAGGVGA